MKSIMLTLRSSEGMLDGAQDTLENIHAYLKAIDAEYVIEFVTIKFNKDLPSVAYDVIRIVAEEYGLNTDSIEDTILVFNRENKDV